MFWEIFWNNLDCPQGGSGERLFQYGVNETGYQGPAHLHGGNSTGELCPPTPSCFDEVGGLKCLQVVLPKISDYAASPARICASAR